jgi:heavy metal translocating P-type ATPase
MHFTIRHTIPGRIRIQMPALEHASSLTEATVAWLRAQAWVVGARISHDAASLIIEYDPADQEVLDSILSLLRHADIDDLRCLFARSSPISANGYEIPTPDAGVVQDRVWGWPLALPTVSLALSLLTSPAALAVNIPLMLFNGAPIFQRAWRVLTEERRLNIDLLDTLAIAASIYQGNMITGGIIVWLIRLGDWIRDLTAAGSRKAISELLEFQGKTAWRVIDDAVVAVPIAELAAGDAVIAYHGELIPVDGEIIHGRAMIDQKTITGESLPVTRGVGEATFAGTIVREGQITIRALRVGMATTAAQIALLVDQAPIGDTRMQNHAEKFADRLVAPSLALAVGAATVTADFDRFLSLVIVDYGTGIRVAAPTTVLSSMTHAARSGIVVKSGRHMERLAEVDTIVFDKTGTLTRGEPVVHQVLAYRNQISPDQLLTIAVAAETRLKHPVARALRSRAAESGLGIPACDEAEFHAGLGVEGQVNGWYVHVGSERFLRQSGIRLDRSCSDIAALNERGESCVLVAVDGEVIGLVSYADQIRDESRAVIDRLHAMGVRDTIMLTGDNATVAQAVRRRLGLTQAFAGLLPADKAEAIQQLQRAGRIVAMVGDGINDSPALSYADVGIAVKHGADIAHESANIVLLEESLWKLVQAVELSREAVGLIKQNYAIVAGMNLVALGLVLPGGLIPPSVTAMISNGSAVLASLNGMRPLLRDQ